MPGLESLLNGTLGALCSPCMPSLRRPAIMTLSWFWVCAIFSYLAEHNEKCDPPHIYTGFHQIYQLGYMSFHSSKYDVVTKARLKSCYIWLSSCCPFEGIKNHSSQKVDCFLKHSWSIFWTFCLANVKYSISNICLSGLVGPFVGKGWVNSKGACLNTSQHNTVLHKLVESNI